MRIKIGKKTLAIQIPISSHTITDVCERGKCEICKSWGVTTEMAQTKVFPFVIRSKDGIVMNAAIFGVFIASSVLAVLSWLLYFFA